MDGTSAALALPAAETDVLVWFRSVCDLRIGCFCIQIFVVIERIRWKVVRQRSVSIEAVCIDVHRSVKQEQARSAVRGNQHVCHLVLTVLSSYSNPPSSSIQSPARLYSPSFSHVLLTSRRTQSFIVLGTEILKHRMYEYTAPTSLHIRSYNLL